MELGHSGTWRERRREGGAPAEESVHRCHLALTQVESETQSFTREAGGSFLKLSESELNTHSTRVPCAMCACMLKMIARGISFQIEKKEVSYK